MDQSTSKHENMQSESPVKGQIHGHMLSSSDPDNPQNWPIYRKVYASVVATSFAFVVAFGITSYTAGISGLQDQFNVSMLEAIAGFSLYLFGIAFAPIYTPHLSERYGRSPVYMVALPMWMLFVLGTGFAQNFATVAICRFFAGVVGGPCLVLIEGTFADVWSARLTVTYYSFLTLASYVGAACGPLIGGFVFAATSWRWTQWITLMLGLAAYLLGIGAPETYAREIVRRRAKRHGVEHRLPLAESGVTLAQMVQITFFTPIRMLFTEPIVILVSVYLALNFAVLFQFFITVPIALPGNYHFSIQQVGLAFIAAIVGVVLATVTSVILDSILAERAVKKTMETMTVNLEYRLYPAMIGCFLMPAALFWIGWTATPSISWASPVLGTLFYVWGSSLTLIAFISYLFDAYPAAGTLSALTVAASLRILFAGWLPLVIIQMFTTLTPAWALSTFGFISIALIPVPFLLFAFGAKWRARSRHAGDGMMTEGQEWNMGEMESATV